MSLTVVSTLLPAPATTRGMPLPISVDDSGAQFAYPAGQLVIVRDVTNLQKATVCNRHTAPVTVARLSNSGALCASGDRDGNVIVWANKADTIVLYQGKLIGGPVRDIAFSDDQERIIAVGEGKTMAAAIAVDGGNTVGNITGHQRNILTCDFKRTRPFRIATGAQDTQVNFYEGPPFKFAHSVTGIHTGNVNCVRYAPDSNLFASCSGGADIWLHDGKTGEKVRSIPSGHSGSVYGVAWSRDSSKIASCSADKSVKVFSAADGALLFSQSYGSAVPHMQLGVTFTRNGILSLSLNGDLNIASPEGGAAAPITHRGHQRPVVALAYVASTGSVVSVSGDGKILVWSDPTSGAVRSVAEGATDIVSGVALLRDKDLVVVGADVVHRVDVADPSAGSAASFAAGAGAPQDVAGLAGDAVAIVCKSSVAVLSGGKKVWEEKLGASFDGASIASRGNTFVVGGDKVARVYEFNGTASAELKRVLQGRHNGTVTAVAISEDGSRIATGDSANVIAVWNAADGTIAFNDLVFHRARVQSIAFAPGTSDFIASGSVDAQIIVWDLPGARRITLANAHVQGVNAVTYGASATDLISGGADGAVRRWTVAW